MIEAEITKRVLAHYAESTDVLLLSDLGVALREASLWPQEGVNRTLTEFVDSIPDVTVMRDPNQRAYVLVVPAGQEALGDEAIRARANTRFLRNLPRAILVAFCLDQASNVPVHVTREPPFRYIIGAPPTDVPVVPLDPEFRTPGLFIDSVDDLDPSEAAELEDNVRRWADKHNISLSMLTSYGRRSTVSSNFGGPHVPSERLPISATAKYSVTALDRLLAAQVPDVAVRLNIPIDIAVTLSRMA